jgi:hypothetical protein
MAPRRRVVEAAARAVADLSKAPEGQSKVCRSNAAKTTSHAAGELLKLRAMLQVSCKKTPAYVAYELQKLQIDLS